MPFRRGARLLDDLRAFTERLARSPELAFHFAPHRGEPRVSLEITTLTLTREESQTVFRALLEHRKALSWSRWADNPAVEQEIQCVDALSERLSLAFFYPPQDEETAA